MTEIEQQIVAYIPRLRRYANALIKGHSSMVEDLVQDCLERALARSHQFQQGTDLRAWLFTIMHNVHANQIRRVSNGPDFVELPETMNESEQIPLHQNWNWGSCIRQYLNSRSISVKFYY